MAYTLLQLIQQASKEMGLSSPSTAAANTATDIVQLVALANATGSELARQFDWQYLNKEHTFSTVFYQYTGDSTVGSTSLTNMSSITGLSSSFMVEGTGVLDDTYVSSAASTTVVISNEANATGTTVTFTFGQTKYSLPADYDRQVDFTHWNKTNQWEDAGPTSPQSWQWLKTSAAATGPRVRYRIMGNTYQVFPMPASETLHRFEYISTYWVTATGSAAPDKTSFTVDTDTCVFPDRLMILGLKLKYFETKGFDTSSLYRDYTRELDISKAHDHGSPTLSMSGKPTSILIGPQNIPDSHFGD